MTEASLCKMLTQACNAKLLTGLVMLSPSDAYWL
jgi:hypothetical protein